MPKLTKGQVQGRLTSVPGWKLRADSIAKTYTFPSFVRAIAFVNHVGWLAEQADHHPDIDIRYKDVTLTFSTHSEGGLTTRDFDAARRVDAT